jgi:hypothetical protein
MWSVGRLPAHKKYRPIRPTFGGFEGEIGGNVGQFAVPFRPSCADSAIKVAGNGRKLPPEPDYFLLAIRRFFAGLRTDGVMMRATTPATQTWRTVHGWRRAGNRHAPTNSIGAWGAVGIMGVYRM